MNEIQAEKNPLSQDFTIKPLLKFAFPTIVMMLIMALIFLYRNKDRYHYV